MEKAAIFLIQGAHRWHVLCPLLFSFLLPDTWNTRGGSSHLLNLRTRATGKGWYGGELEGNWAEGWALNSLPLYFILCKKDWTHLVKPLKSSVYHIQLSMFKSWPIIFHLGDALWTSVSSFYQVGLARAVPTSEGRREDSMQQTMCVKVLA